MSLKEKIPGFDIFVNGHALARNEEALERLAATLHVSPLLKFFRPMKTRWLLLLEQGPANPEWARNLPQPQWFAAADGLLTVRALIDFLPSKPAAIGSETFPVLLELREYERVLKKTAERGLRWHLAASWR